MSRHVGRGETRANSARESPSHHASPFRQFSEGQFVRCPNCQCLTTMGDIVDGCPNCKFDPIKANRRRDIAASANAINAMGAPRVMELNDRQYARLLGKYRRKVA